MRKDKNLVIIPLRKGSVRLQNKNKLDFNGLPLFMHTVQYALTFKGLIDRVVISTNDEEIKSITKEIGIDFIDRPDTLAKNDTPTIDVLKHVLEQLDEDFDNVILLQATNPLRPKSLLKDCLDAYLSKNCDSLLTVSNLNKKFGVIKEGTFHPKNYNFGQRFQDMEELYYENGLLYISKSDLIKKGKIIGELNYPYIIDHPFSQIDIDTKEDLDLAKWYYKLISG